MRLFPIVFGVVFVAVVFVIVWRIVATSRRSAKRGAPNQGAARSQTSVAFNIPAVAPANTDDAAQFDCVRALYALALGDAILTRPVGSPHNEVMAAAAAQLVGIADKPNYAPRRPMLLPKLVQAMNDDDVSRRELSAIIAGDPALAGSLLRLANSPFYRLSPDPIESLDRAVAVLGIEGMRSLISAALLQPVFRISGGGFAKFGDIIWQHTLYAGKAAEAHAAILENSDPFAAQLLALMMGLAVVVVFRVGSDEYQSRGMSADGNTLEQLIETRAAEVARHIAASWELSERMTGALIDPATKPSNSLGRSLQFGEYLGSLAMLHEHRRLSDDDIAAAFKSAGALQGAYERIWARLKPPAGAQA